MFCGQCGKRVMENMLFCPFCGSPIVIPDQDGEAVQPKIAEETPKEIAAQPEPAESKPQRAARSLFEEDEPAPDEKRVSVEEFVPLAFDFDAPDADAKPAPEPSPAAAPAAPAQKSAEIVDVPEEAPPMRRAKNGVRPQGRRPARTYIPPKDVDVDDLFMDQPDEYDQDDYDSDDYDSEADYDSGFGNKSYEYVEEETGSFFSRHIRGIVALILLGVVIVVAAIWSISDRGQTTLAQLNLAWKASSYSALADEAYKAGAKMEAAQYYEKAFARDMDNYEYAHSSMVAYYQVEEIEKAAAMLKKCIALRPNDVEPYQEMLVLYPDAASRPWEITEIVRDGYSRTGDERLNVN